MLIKAAGNVCYVHVWRGFGFNDSRCLLRPTHHRECLQTLAADGDPTVGGQANRLRSSSATVALSTRSSPHLLVFGPRAALGRVPLFFPRPHYACAGHGGAASTGGPIGAPESAVGGCGGWGGLGRANADGELRPAPLFVEGANTQARSDMRVNTCGGRGAEMTRCLPFARAVARAARRLPGRTRSGGVGWGAGAR